MAEKSKYWNLNIRLDPGLRGDIEEIFNSLGLTVTDAVQVYFAKCIAVGGFPFEVNLTPEEREKMREVWQKAKHRKDGKEIARRRREANDHTGQ